MFRIVGIVSTAIVASIILLLIDNFSGSSIVSWLICDDYIAIMATLIWLNMATVAFLVWNINTIELSTWEKAFSRVREELRQNITFMLIALLPLWIIAKWFYDCETWASTLIDQMVLTILLSTFVLWLYCIYETTQMIFKIKL